MALDLATVLIEAFVKVAAAKTTEKTIDGILNWAKTPATQKKLGKLTQADQEKLNALLRSDRSVLSSLKAQFKFTDRRGLLVVGPSGGGKSRILRALIGEDQTSETTSTGLLTTSTMRIGSRITYSRPHQSTKHGRTF